MNIIKLIDYLQQIAAINPNATVYVEDGYGPSDGHPVDLITTTAICGQVGNPKPGDVYLGSNGHRTGFNLGHFKPQ